LQCDFETSETLKLFPDISEPPFSRRDGAAFEELSSRAFFKRNQDL